MPDSRDDPQRDAHHYRKHQGKHGQLQGGRQALGNQFRHRFTIFEGGSQVAMQDFVHINGKLDRDRAVEAVSVDPYDRRRHP